MTATCEAVDIFLGIAGSRCGLPAAPYRRICVHEHRHDGPLCPGHANDRAAGLCRECFCHPTDPHECGIHLQPLAGIS
jgi:hypothetical protein